MSEEELSLGDLEELIAKPPSTEKHEEPQSKPEEKVDEEKNKIPIEEQDTAKPELKSEEVVDELPEEILKDNVTVPTSPVTEPKVEEKVEVEKSINNLDELVGDETVIEEPVKAEPPKPEPVPVEKSLEEQLGLEKPDELVVEEETATDKEVYAIAGEKGMGKTYLAFGFPGKKVCIALDNKSVIVKNNDFKNDPNIIVYSGTKYYHTQKKSMITKSAANTFIYLNKILDTIERNSVDWIIIDNFEQLSRIAEFCARFYNKLPPFAGTGSVGWKLWDERNYYLNTIYNRCFNLARKGVIYTLYMKTEDTLVVDGQVIEKKEQPKWIQQVLYETDIALKVWREDGKRKYIVEVLTSKDDKKLPNGKKFDITDTNLFDAITQ